MPNTTSLLRGGTRIDHVNKHSVALDTPGGERLVWEVFVNGGQPAFNLTFKQAGNQASGVANASTFTQVANNHFRFIWPGVGTLDGDGELQLMLFFNGVAHNQELRYLVEVTKQLANGSVEQDQNNAVVFYKRMEAKSRAFDEQLVSTSIDVDVP